MADLTPTPLGYHTQAPDGSDVFLPEDVARTVFPDNFAAPHNDTPEALGDNSAPPPADIPVPTAPGEAPSLGVSPLSPPTMPPPSPPDQGGLLPPGVDKARLGYSGYSGRLVNPHGLIDVNSVTEPYDQSARNISAVGEEQKAADAYKAGIESQQAQAEQPVYAEQTKSSQGAEDAYAKLATKTNEVLAQHEQAVQAAINNIPNEDPNRWWNNKSGFDKAITAITFMLSGIASNGGPNQAVDMAMHLIDQDMRAQETDIATAKAKVGYAENAYQRADKSFYHQKLDLEEQQALRLATISAKLKQVGASFKSQLTQADHFKAAADIDAKVQQLQAESVQRRQQAAMEAIKTNLQLGESRADRAQRERHFSEQMDLERDKAAGKAGQQANAGIPLGKATGFTHLEKDQNGKPVQVGGIRVNTGDPVRDRDVADKLGKMGLATNHMYEVLDHMRHLDFSHVRGFEQLADLNSDLNKVILDYSDMTGQKLSRETEQDVARQVSAILAANKLGHFDIKDDSHYKAAINRMMDEMQKKTDEASSGLTGDETFHWNPPSLEQPKPNEGYLRDPGSLAIHIQNTGFDPRVSGDHDNVRSVLEGAKTLVEDTKAGRVPLSIASGSVDMLYKKAQEMRDAGYVKDASYLLDLAQKQRDAWAEQQFNQMTKANATRDLKAKERAVLGGLAH